MKGHARDKAKADALYDKSARTERIRLYRREDFALAQKRSHCVCQAGKRLYSNGKHCTIGAFSAVKFCGAQQDCVPCNLRARCLRFADRTQVRQVAFFQGRPRPSHSDRMKERIDSPTGRQMIARGFATVEPVFANLRHNKRLNRFTLRGKPKVAGQWNFSAWCTTSRNGASWLCAVQVHQVMQGQSDRGTNETGKRSMTTNCLASQGL